MASHLLKRPRSLLLLVLAVLASLLAAAPPAHAELSEEAWSEVSYNCSEGQTVTFVPGQARLPIPGPSPDAAPIGYAEVLSARLDVMPVEQLSYAGHRYQLESRPGTQTTFHEEAGLPLNANKTIWFRYIVTWDDSGPYQYGSPQYLPSEVRCDGTPTDTDRDDDGVNDDVDVCPDAAAVGSPDGCPAGVTISVVDTKAGDQTAGVSGSATVSVTNVVDGAGTESYRVWFGDQSVTVDLADGAVSSPLTFTGQPGDWSICAQSGTRALKSCVSVTVANAPPPAPVFAGTVKYTQACTGLRYTITNTGDQPLKASIMLTYMGNSLGTVTEWSLAPGQSKTATTNSYFNTTIKPTLYSTDYATYSQALAGMRWVQPSGCPYVMIGGTKLIKWGPQLTRYNGTPTAVVSTKAYKAIVGYQIKGSSRIRWAATYTTQEQHRFSTLFNVRRHRQVTIRLWVVYVDHAGNRAGKTAFTTWRTFKRP